MNPGYRHKYFFLVKSAKIAIELTHCCNHHSHHFGYHVDAFVGGLLIEIGDAIAVAEIEIHPDAYDADAVVGLRIKICERMSYEESKNIVYICRYPP